MFFRSHASAVVFVTNHRYCDEVETNWKALVDSGATLVIYMPGSDYGATASKLEHAGLDGQTPCVIVSNASKSNQQTHATRVADLPSAPPMPAPALLLIGSVTHRALARIAEQIPCPPPDAVWEAEVDLPANAQGD